MWERGNKGSQSAVPRGIDFFISGVKSPCRHFRWKDDSRPAPEWREGDSKCTHMPLTRKRRRQVVAKRCLLEHRTRQYVYGGSFPVEFTEGLSLSRLEKELQCHV
ncbi:hypothetical protein Bbelb_275820 [Branchiostoma belcheri]|nr:hypothetical protein Bbelb_275820 [Branchiostoma belcheri]